VLSHHPEIVCFHGVKTLAAAPMTDRTAPLARQFVRDLDYLYWAAQGEQVFGAIHGFAAIQITPEIRAAEGAFAAMIRHPITRLNSLFHRTSQVVGTVDLPRDDIYRPFLENEQCLAEIACDKASHPSPLTILAREFEALCTNVLAEDTFILQGMDRQDIFQYERIVVDPEYFRSCFERLAEGCRHFMAISTTRRGAVRLECTQDYLDRVFKLGIVNRKNSGEREAEAIFAKWPSVFKVMFSRQLERQGGKDAVDRYAEFGYRLPSAGHHSSLWSSRASDFSQLRRGATAPIASGVELERNDYPVAAPPVETPSLRPIGPEGALATTSSSSNSLKQMLAIIDVERAAHADQLRSLQEIRDAERDAAGARIKELQDALNAERDAFCARIKELQDTLEAEREAFRARIKELQDTLDAEREAFRARIKELQDTLDAEREAFRAEIKELQDTLDAERDAFRAQIKGAARYP
jgi:hypothetical protein